jgi:hypothetical protein
MAKEFKGRPVVAGNITAKAVVSGRASTPLQPSRRVRSRRKSRLSAPTRTIRISITKTLQARRCAYQKP